MSDGVLRLPGEQLAAWLARPGGAPARVEVTSPPPGWGPLKPALVRFVRACRAGGGHPPAFRGVPLCLFGSEWSGFPSAEPAAPPLGRCAACQARARCGFGAAVPDELLPISEAPLLARWRAHAAAFRDVTGSAMALAATPHLERILALYRGPVSLEPSVLLSGAVEPSARVVVFPHRLPEGAAAAAAYRDVLRGTARLLADLGMRHADPLLAALASLPPSPLPVGLESRGDAWRVKMYLRLEDASPVRRQAALAALARFAPDCAPVPLADLHMLGLVLDGDGLHTVKAYLLGRPTGAGGAGFPAPLPSDHPLLALAGGGALATLDVWNRGPRRDAKWDVNVREHYLAGAAAERLLAALASPQRAAALRPLLRAPTHRADLVAIGLRGPTLALYMELN
ncbi:hypothetical protein KF840_16145 [bacterium]|nr:hypothetical protein [bacterium]